MLNKAKFRISENTIRKTANKIGDIEEKTEWTEEKKQEQILIILLMSCLAHV